MSAPEHGNLPLRDYDQLPVSAVGQLLDYERAHAGRPAVTRVMETWQAP